MISRATPILTLVSALAVTLTACAQDTGTTTSTAETTPHGYVEGAEETAEPQPRLVVADGGTGEVVVLDLISERTTSAGTAPGVERAATDGRFAYLSAGRTVHVVDGGSWTVDHGDHKHYYRAEARTVGTLPHGPAAGVHSDSVVTAVVSGDGGTALLDRSALEDGEVTTREPVRDGTVVPLDEHLVVATGNGEVEVRARGGDRVTVLDQRCRDPLGTAVTRRGLVLGCEDGALLVSEDDGKFAGERIPYPGQVPAAQRAREFTHRPGSATLVARAGERGVWLLDVGTRRWRLFDTGPVVAANTAGEGTPLLTLTRDGVLHALDPSTGKETASKGVLNRPVPAGDGVVAPVIRIDTSRAYVNDAAARAVHEIDYADNLRVARTLRLDVTPTHLVETGQ